jgi:site-specific DNA recombinase
MRLAAYTRVSSTEQDTLAAQLEACRGFAARLGGSIVLIESDKLSGLDTARPGYVRVLDAARRGDVDGVLVWKLDRFGRDAAESIRAAAELTRLGVRVHSASEPADDPFVRELLLVVAGQESRNTSARVRMKMRADAAEGKWPGRPPVGYSLDAERRLFPNGDAVLVARLFDEAATGRFSYAALRDMADSWGLRFPASARKPNGSPLSRSRIGTVLHNPAYVGDVVYGRRPHGRFQASHQAPESEWVVARDAHPAIVGRETFATVARAFEQHAHVPSSAAPTGYLLTGVVRCGFCGGRMYGLRGSHGYSYACHRASEYTCEQRSVGGVRVDRYVTEHLQGFMTAFSVDTRREAERILRDEASARQREATDQRSHLKRRREAIETERMARARNMLSSLVPPDVYARLESQDLDALRILDAELAGLDIEPTPDPEPVLAALEAIDPLELDRDAWRDLVLLFVERVEVRRSEKRGQPDVQITWKPEAAVVERAIRQIVESQAATAPFVSSPLRSRSRRESAS